MFIDTQNFADRRSSQRVGFREPVSFRFSNSEESKGCLAQDISAGGLRINYEHFIRPNTDMSFDVKLKGTPVVLKMPGHVAWTRRLPCSDRYQLGIEFSEDNVYGRKEIQRYVEASQPRRF